MTNLRCYRTLGRSGLVVSPMALGAMTFGTARWGADADASRAIFEAYVEAGGNFVDTADIYAGGRSEEFVGRFVADSNLRDRIVISTKFTWNQDPGNPNAGGNGRKNVMRAVDASLRRLGTDYIDLYWLHFWDMVTPVEEVLQTFNDLIRAGKIRYFALSDVPAWYAARMVTLAEERGLAGPIALQMEYSLVERTIEHEHMPFAAESGLGILPWSPLAGGFLTGKYVRGTEGTTGRLSGENPFGDSKFNDRNWDVLDSLRAVAEEIGVLPAQAALAWVAQRPGVTGLLLGASRPAQVADNVAALAIEFTPAQKQRLDDASALKPGFPYYAFNEGVRKSIFGGVDVSR